MEINGFPQETGTQIFAMTLSAFWLIMAGIVTFRHFTEKMRRADFFFGSVAWMFASYAVASFVCGIAPLFLFSIGNGKYLTQWKDVLDAFLAAGVFLSCASAGAFLLAGIQRWDRSPRHR